MLIHDVHELTRALDPILKKQVVVRHSVTREVHTKYSTDVLALCQWDDSPHLARLMMQVEIDRQISIESKYSIEDVGTQPTLIQDAVRDWYCRSFDDWCHAEPFMGAYAVYRQGQLYTSIKWDAEDERWRFLNGMILSHLQHNPAEVGTAAHKGRATLGRRFSAFVAGSERAWSEKRLSAR